MFTPSGTAKYRVMSLLSGQVLELNNGKAEKNNYTIQWPWAKLVRTWRFTISNGLYEIEPNGVSNLRLGVKNGSVTRDAQIVLYDQLADDQFWRIVTDVNGCTFSIVNNKSNMLMSVQGESTTNAAHIVQTPADGTMGQKWMATAI